MEKLPRVYLIASTMSDEDKVRVRAAIEIAPSTGNFVFNDKDALLIQELSTAPVMTASAPIAIMGDFNNLLLCVNSDGSVDTIL